MSSTNRIVTQEAWGRARQAAVWPIYLIALILDFASAALGRLGAWIAGDDWP